MYLDIVATPPLDEDTFSSARALRVPRPGPRPTESCCAQRWQAGLWRQRASLQHPTALGGGLLDVLEDGRGVLLQQPAHDLRVILVP
jgi:hypothetical protein